LTYYIFAVTLIWAVQMAISDRVRIIISERGLKQKEFARSIHVTDSYISKLLRDESGMSNTTAMLIEELYGYSQNWILTGKEPKMGAGLKSKDFSPLQNKIIFDVEQMSEAELCALAAFIDSLKSYRQEQTG
jgi:transcriptional regulator with XRE-family HTH domain